MPPHHPHHHGGHIPQSGFPWGNWGWAEPRIEYVVVEQESPVPDWVWIAGGALAGILLAVLARGR